MASNKHTSASSNGRQPIPRSNSDMARWGSGIVLLFLGLFFAAAVFFSYFCWSVDQSSVNDYFRRSAEERALLGIDFVNPCGKYGAIVGNWLVDKSFGFFGILIPVMLTLLGLRIVRQRPLRLNRTFLPLAFVLIFGSLTFGFLLPNLNFISSAGPGGEFGVEAAKLLRDSIGAIGMIILLLMGWILTGVLINRNFINTVNAAGNAMVDRSEKIVDIMVNRPSESSEEDDYEDDADEESPFEDETDREPAVPVVPVIPEPVVTPVPSAPDSPFVDPDEADVPVVPEPEIVRPAAPVVPVPERPTAVNTPIFTEEPLSDDGADADPAGPSAAGRVVMGRGGLVELDRPSVPSPRRPLPPTGSPFEEIADPDSEPAEQPAPALPESPELPVPVLPVDPDNPFVEEPLPQSEPEAVDEQAGGVVVTVEEHPVELVDERKITTESYDPMKDLINYRKPSVSLLEDYQSDSEVSDEEIFENKTKIEETLKYFGIPIQRIRATVGPTVTLYEIVQAQGVKISKIQGLQNDIAQSLKAESGIRIIAPIPGRGTIGIEVPNRSKQVVSMYSAVRSLRFQEAKAALPVVIGRTIQNENFVFDLAKMPHLLVAGATSMGKSVGLNAIITSLLYKKHPAELKFVLIDPKRVEFTLYAKLERHFLAKMESEEKAVVTDPQKAVYTLNSLCVEMENRLNLCEQAEVRNIIEYNRKFTERRLNPQKGHRYLPYIVVIIDEFADLIMTAKEVEMPVTRLAQKARAVGIHLIIATQRPSVDIITGRIKANFPARIAFRVMQMIDSRTILDRPGAEQLIGRGDMLISNGGELTRIQCALVDTPEVERIVEHISKQQAYGSAYALPDYTPDAGEGGAGLGSEESSAPQKFDALFAEIARDAVESGSISTSMIQRNYEVGFNRAGRIMMQLERCGIVGRQQGAKPRDILFHDLPSLEAKLQELGLF